MHAYIYARFSSAEQAKGSSLERQLHNCRAFCEAKGWSHSASRELVDEGISAYDGSNRSGQSSLAKFERMAHAGDIPNGSVLVVERLDRISRESPHAVVRFVSSMLEANIAIAIASNDRLYVGDVPFDQLIDMVVTAKLSNEESEKKSERLRAAWARKRRCAAEGVPLTSICPAWLHRSEDGTRYLVDADKADIVHRIFEMATSGHGRSLIAQTLNKEGIPPISGRSNGWHPSYIQKILRGRAVLGEAQLYTLESGRRVPQNVPLANYYPPIVSHDLYRKAQASIHARTSKGGRRGPQISNLFTGLVKCIECGGSLTYRNKGKLNEQYLVCDGALRSRGCQSRRHWNYHVVEDCILTESLSLLIDLDQRPKNERLQQILDRKAKLESQVEDIRARRDRILDLLSRGPDDQAEALFRRLRDDLAITEKRAKEACEDLLLAQSELPTQEHAVRLQAVRNDIQGDGPDRLAVRLEAQQAARSVIDRITFDAHNQHVTAVLTGGIAAFRFTISGEVIARSSDLDKIAAVPDLAAAWGRRADDVARVAQRAAMAGRKRGNDEASLATVVQPICRNR